MQPKTKPNLSFICYFKSNPKPNSKSSMSSDNSIRRWKRIILKKRKGDNMEMSSIKANFIEEHKDKIWMVLDKNKARKSEAGPYQIWFILNQQYPESRFPGFWIDKWPDKYMFHKPESLCHKRKYKELNFEFDPNYVMSKSAKNSILNKKLLNTDFERKESEEKWGKKFKKKTEEELRAQAFKEKSKLLTKIHQKITTLMQKSFWTIEDLEEKFWFSESNILLYTQVLNDENLRWSMLEKQAKKFTNAKLYENAQKAHKEELRTLRASLEYIDQPVEEGNLVNTGINSENKEPIVPSARKSTKEEKNSKITNKL